MTVTLYDLDSTLPERAFMPNPFKIRIALAYKGVPFTTEWAEWHELTDKLKAIGAPPSSTNAAGEERYTTPTIFDSSTGKAITESATIAQYLDDTYAEMPELFPPGTKDAIMDFDKIWKETVQPPLVPFAVLPVYTKINPASRPYFRESRERMVGCKLEEVLTPANRAEKIETLREAFSQMATRYFQKESGEMKSFFLGDTFSFADCVVGGYLLFMKRGLNSEDWAAIAENDGGYWARVVAYCESLSGYLS